MGSVGLRGATVAVKRPEFRMLEFRFWAGLRIEPSK